MTDDPVPTRRRRRRAVWRAGEGISRTDEVVSRTDEVVSRTDEAASRPDEGTSHTDEVVSRPDDDSAATAATTEVDDAAAEAKPRRRRADPSERGLRDLVGAGPSQLGPVRAMRARDANRPTAADLAEAEQDVVIVHRHWKPPN